MNIQLAQPNDLTQIIAIYNQAIPCRRITADLQPVTEQSRQNWFNQHLNNPHYPIWVLEENTNNLSSTITQDQKILGWCCFSPFYEREAFYQAAEISVYLDNNVKGLGYGSKAVTFMQSQMASCGITTLMAYVIEENVVSRKMFEKQGFQQWGRYPNIANMGDSLQTFLIYGFQLPN